MFLDDDVARLVADAMQRDGQSMEQVINGALRRGLSANEVGTRPFHVEVHRSALRPGINPGRLNQLADHLTDADAGVQLTTGLGHN